jgi:hypothetical protein
MTWRFDWLTSWDEIWSESFVAQWHEWMRESPTSHVFFHPTLARVWVDTYLGLRRMEPQFLVAKNDNCTAFLPMVLWCKNWKNAFQRTLIPVGYADYDYHDPIVSGKISDSDWDGFWNSFEAELSCHRLGTEYDLVVMLGIRKSPSLPGAGWLPEESCPFIDLSQFGDLAGFLETLSAKHRYNLRRRRRLLESEGPVTFEVLGPGDKARAQCDLLDMLDHHSRRWPDAYKAPNLHKNLIENGISEGLVHFSKLCLGGKAISWRVGFTYGDRFYSYMPAYDAAYERFSPGQLHLLLTIGEAIERKLSMFDQLRGEESYKAAWANRVVQLYSLRIAGDSFGSRVRNMAADQLKPGLAKLVRRRRKRTLYE